MLAGHAAAASLTQSQIQAVVSLLQAFGVSTTTISSVQTTLSGGEVTSTSATSSTTLMTGNMIGFLRFGAKGNGVKILQIVLAADPSVYPEGVISGYFGTLTQNALKRYQKKYGLEQVGYIGPKTLKKLEDDMDENPVATESNDSNNATSTVSVGNNKHLCVAVPPGHLIAPGWLRKQGGQRPEIPSCQVLPPGIQNKLSGGTTTTPDTTAPVLSAITVGSITSSSAVISWTTNENATSKVNYGTTTAYGSEAALGNTLSLTHSVSLSGLASSTLYHFRVTSKDSSLNTATSSDMTFTTLAAPDTTVPAISGVSVGFIASTSAQILWTTNENATSKVYFRTVTPLILSTAATTSSTVLSTSHSLTLSPLTASTTYYYIIESADASNNTATTSQASFLTTN